MALLTMKAEAEISIKRNFKLQEWVAMGTIAAIVLIGTISLAIGVIFSNSPMNESKTNDSSSLARRGDDAKSPLIVSFFSSPATNSAEGPSSKFVDRTPPAPIAAPVAARAPSKIETNTTLTTFAAFHIATPERRLADATSIAPVSSDSLATSSVPSQSRVSANHSTVATFYTHGDVPYTDAQAVLLKQQMKTVPKDAQFVVFVGDVRDGSLGLTCVEEDYKRAASLFRLYS